MATNFPWFAAALMAIILAAGFQALLMASPDQTPPAAGPKVFVIGLSKTGTTSLGDALATLGMKRSGWEDIRSRWLYLAYSRGNLGPLISHTRRFDAFEDIPWAQAYREFADIYPTARFILSVRRDEEGWLRSIGAHTERRLWHGHGVVYGCVRARECGEAYLDAYRRHNAEVVDFFKGRNESERLLTFVIDEPTRGEDGVDEKWARLLEFLEGGSLGGGKDGLEIQSLGNFPFTNSKRGFGNRDPFGVHWAVDRLFYVVEVAAIKLSGIV